MLPDGIDLTVMKKRITLVYIALAGWFGVILSLVMPLAMFSTADDEYKYPLFFPLWIIGSGITLLMGIVMLIYRRKMMISKVGLFFVVVALLSIAGATLVYFQNDTYTEQTLPLGPPKIPGGDGN